MKTVKPIAAFLFLFAVSMLAGCGGAQKNNARIAVTPRFVPVTLGLQWSALAAPATGTRLVAAPANALSVVVRLTDLTVNPADENDLVTVAVINRDTGNTGAYTQTFTTSGAAARPNADTYAELRFYSGLNGAGALVGSTKKFTKLPANGDLGDFDEATAIVSEQN